MPPRHIPAAALLCFALVSIGAEDKSTVPFPEGYRKWQHVKTILIGPEHPTYARRGGMHHYYANDLALSGYKTGVFPQGSVIVDENVLTQEGEGPAKGILLESDRRMIEVMVKDARRYPDTAGWGYERFERDNRTGALTKEQQSHCSQCHAAAQARDAVFSRIRP